MKEWAELLTAVGNFLWPVFAFYVVWQFKDEIESLLRRIKSGKFLGQELALVEELKQLSVSANAAAVEVEAIPRNDELQVQGANFDDVERKVIEMAAQSPKAALLLLSSEIEKVLFELLGGLGLLNGRSYVPFRTAFELLAPRLPLPVLAPVEHFWQTRNHLVHGQGAEDGALSAIDSGITILRALRAVYCESHTVYHPSVDVFSDPACQVKRQEVRGVILETKSDTGLQVSRRIYATNQIHFKKGMRVAWEWKTNGPSFGESWYRDPDTGEIQIAWSESKEFVGRSLNDIVSGGRAGSSEGASEDGAASGCATAATARAAPQRRASAKT
jgi:hypothetical protein